MKRLIAWCKSHWWILLGLLLLCLALGLNFRSPTLPAQVTVLRSPYQMPAQGIHLGRWIPATPAFAWLWRLKEGLFGRRKSVTIYGEVIALENTTTLPGPSLGGPNFSGTNGLQIWLLSEAQLKTVREHLKQTSAKTLFRPGVSSGDKVSASLSIGSAVPVNGAMTHVGLSADFFTRVRGESIDLTAVFRLTELITNIPVARVEAGPGPSLLLQTNLDLGVQLHIPKGSGALFFNGGAGETNRKRIAVIIDPPQVK